MSPKVRDMEIVVISDFGFVEGGASKVALTSAEALARRGHHVSLLVGVGDQNPSGEAIDFYSAGGFSTSSNPRRGAAAFEGFWNVKTRKLLRDVIENCGDRTIFHLHSWTKALSPSVLEVLRGVSPRVVLTVHDYFTACPNGGFYNFPSGHICPLAPLSLRCLVTNCDSRSYPQKVWRVGRQVIQSKVARFPEWCRHFVVLSETSKLKLAPYLPAHAIYHSVPNPVARLHAEPVDPGANSDFVMIGRLGREKGPDVFARAAESLGISAKFIGDGSERSQVLELNPTARVSGWLSEKEVADELGQSRTLIFPSRWLEVAPLVVREAALSGIPCLVSDRSAAREFVLDGNTGFIFRDGDHLDLAAKIREMQASDVLVRRMGKAAHSLASNSVPTPQEHAAMLENVYQEMLEAAGETERGREPK